MSSYIDFASLKEAVSIDQVAEWLRLDLKKQPNGQLRGCCPMHNGGNEREFVITPSKGLFFCFGPCGGGDCIKLAAQVLKIGTREAALEIAKSFCGGKNTVVNSTVKEKVPSHRTVPPSITQKGPKSGDLQPLQPLEGLSTTHEAIEALGLSEAVCLAAGIGYCSKGLMRARVAFPIRLPDGTLIGYQGLATRADQSPLILFPANLDQRIASPPQPIEAPKQSADEIRKLFRIVR